MLVLFYLFAPWGIGIHKDSVAYIFAADLLKEGKDASIALRSKWPPFFPFMISFISYFGFSLEESCKIINVSFFGVNIFLGGYIVYRVTQSVISGCIAALLLIISPVFVYAHIMAMSEPLFLFIAFYSYFLLILYLSYPEKKFLLYLSASGIGFATITRYAGLAFIAAGVFSILLFCNKSFIKRFKESIIFGAIAFFPIILWGRMKGTSPHQGYNFHLPGFDKLLEGLKTGSKWIFDLSLWPQFNDTIALIIFFVFVFALTYLYIKQKKNRADNNLSIITVNMFLILAASYIVLVTGFILFKHVNGSLDNRKLLPIFLALYLVVFILFTSNVEKRKMLLMIALIFTSYAATSSFQSFKTFSRLKRQGIGLKSKKWSKSKLIKRITELPKEASIFTNTSSKAIEYISGRKIRSLPSKINKFNSLKKNREISFAKIKKYLSENPSYVVIFDNARIRRFGYKEREIVEALDLIDMEEYADGTIFVPR